MVQPACWQKALLAMMVMMLLPGGKMMAQIEPAPKHEMRAVWLTTIGGIDWPHSYNSKKQVEELRQTLDQLKKAGVNTVLLQTRVRGTTIYPSKLEPWDGCITGHPGKAPSYDPLQLAIDECHKRGMQLHAWVVTIPVGKWNKLGCQQLRKTHPDLICKIGEDGFMDPEKPGTADYLASCCREIVDHYDVDGIHLDYIRYPETWPKSRSRKLSLSVRRGYITQIVEKIHKEVKEKKPWVMLSCSPVGKHDDLSRYRSGGWNARTAVCQDAQKWLKDSLMDALFPMMYFRDNQFFPFAIDWQERSCGRIVAPGLGIYFLDPKEGRWELSDVQRQMHVARQLGMGHCYFRSKFFTDNVKGVYDFAISFDGTPALVPPMTWTSKVEPAAPVSLRLERENLCWGDTIATDSLQYHLYNIYASPDFPVDVSKAENLVMIRWRDSTLRVPMNNRLNYAVTVVDRYGQESKASQLLVNAGPRYAVPEITITDGRPILLPKKPSILDAEFILVETLSGMPISTFSYIDGPLDVSSLPDGIYQLRSLGRKNRNHRIGFFAIKRSRLEVQDSVTTVNTSPE